jgi:ankyrin repeat protein
VTNHVPFLTKPSFLHAYYATKDVCEQVNISGIRKAASKQHKDANVIYTVTLEQINGLAATKKELAYRTIAWLTFTKKPFQENEFKEAFAIDNRNGRIDSTVQPNVENVIEYCRGLVVRVKTRKLSYLRLAHMTAQEYFSRVEFFQQYHVDMCLTCFNRVISCLIPNRMANQVQDSPDNQGGRTQGEYDYLADAADGYISDSSINEVSEEPNFLGPAEEDDKEYSEEEDDKEHIDEEDDDDDGEGDDGEANEIPFEDHQSWRFSGDVWPQTLLPWIAKKTPFSLYAGSYAVSHLKDSTITSDIEKTILSFIKNAFSRRRRSMFSGRLQDHPYGMNMLHMASFLGIPSIVEEVLRMPMIQVDDRDLLGRTALMWALGLGKETIAERLLEGGAQVQGYDRQQRSTLMYASAVKNEALLTKLLQRVPEKDINASFLLSCAKANNVYLVDGALSRANINVNQIDENGRTPIHEAVISGSEAAVRSLILYGAQVSVPDCEGRTPLMYAAEGQNSEIAEILITAGANPNTSSQKGESPLHVAAKNTKGDPRILRTLLRAGANIFFEDEYGLVPLQALLRICRDQYRSEKRTLACVQLLSGIPDTVSHQSHDGANALHDAVQCPYISVLKYLVSRAPPDTVNSQKNRGQTPIFEALIACNIPAFDVLINLPGIDLLKTRDDKKALLNCAAWTDEITVAQKLISKEPRLINLAEQHCVSAIHYAVERDSLEMFELLLDAGSDPRSRRHKFNRNLISYAAFEGRVWCLDTLLKLRAWMTYDQSGQLVAHKDDLGKTLLHEAAASASPAVLQKILNSLPLEGLSLEDRDALGQTPLHYAVRTRKEPLVSLLLTAKSDKDALTNTGATPLDLALEFEAGDTVRTLVLADANVGQSSHPILSKIQCYRSEDFFAKLKDIIGVPTSIERNDITTDFQPYKEKTVHRTGTEYDVFDQGSPDIPFLEVIVPENAALPINQVIFETVSHDQGETYVLRF